MPISNVISWSGSVRDAEETSSVFQEYLDPQKVGWSGRGFDPISVRLEKVLCQELDTNHKISDWMVISKTFDFNAWSAFDNSKKNLVNVLVPIYNKFMSTARIYKHILHDWRTMCNKNRFYHNFINMCHQQVASNSSYPINLCGHVLLNLSRFIKQCYKTCFSLPDTQCTLEVTQ